MKVLILTDTTINKTELGQVTREVAEIYQNNANITFEWRYQDFDFTDYPIMQYWGGYWGMAHTWLRDRCAEVYRRYAEDIDCVVFAVASPNWKLDDPTIVGDKGVWGWNMSAQFSGYGVQQVRIAQNPRHTTQRNINNSIGVLYHEMHHDHDTFVFVNTGKTVEPIVGVRSWDNGITHGGEAPWQYMRFKENQASIKAIAPVFREALTARRRIWETKKSLYERVIQLAEQYIALLRQQLAAQRGDIAILADNKCVCCKK